MSSSQHAPEHRRLLLLWEEDPGPGPGSNARDLYFLGLDAYSGTGWYVVGYTNTARWDLSVADSHRFGYDTFHEFAGQLARLEVQYGFECGYLDVLESYRPLLRTFPQLSISRRITRSYRNQIRAAVRSYVSEGVLDRSHARTASENDESADQSYNDAFGLMVMAYHATRQTENQRLSCRPGEPTLLRSTTGSSG